MPSDEQTATPRPPRPSLPGQDSGDLEAGRASIAVDEQGHTGLPSRESQEDLVDPATKKGTPSASWTGHQLFYVFGLDGIGATVLSGGANFAIAYAMYGTQKHKENATPIVLWELPNTLAGDAAVTIFVQCVITWLVELFLVNYDLRKGSVQAIGFISEPSRPWIRWFFMLPPDRPGQFGPEESGRAGRGFSVLTVVNQLIRALLIAVASFLIVWPISIGGLIPLGEKYGGDLKYPFTWTPEIFKLLEGGILALLTTPVIAMFWLVKAGWEAKDQGMSSHRDGELSD